MARSATVEAATIRAESSYRNQLDKRYGELDQTEKEVLGKAWLSAEQSVQDIEEIRVKRVDAINKQVSDYYRSQDAGSAAQRMRTLQGLYTAALQNQTSFANAAFRPNLALIDQVTRGIPDYNRPGVDRRAYAREAWAAFAPLAKAQGAGAAGTYDWMVETFGPPSEAGFATGDKLYGELSALTEMRDRAFREAEEFQAKARGFTDTFEKWAQQKGLDPTDPSVVDRYVAENKLGPNDIPLPSSSYVEGLKDVSENPASTPLYFSDIDPIIEQRKKQATAAKEEFRSYRGEEAKAEEEAKPEIDLTERERLVGWLQQEDARDWAASHGFRLGTVRAPTQKELADIEAGRLPRDYLVKGMVYSPSPDDEQAVRFAERQMSLKPQESLLYQLGLRGDRTRRGVSEITVETEPATPDKPVRALKMVRFAGGTYVVGDDGKFYSSTDEGNSWTPVADDVGKDAFASGTDIEIKSEDDTTLPGVSKPGTPAKTKTYTIEEQGWIYGRDKGVATGIDATPGSPTFGQRISFPKEQVVSRERIGLERIRPTLAEQMRQRRAERIEAERQKEERALIGPKAAPGAVKERAETAKRLRAELPAAVSTEPGALLEEKGITGPIESPALQMLPEAAGAEGAPTRQPEIFERRAQPVSMEKMITPKARANLDLQRDISRVLEEREQPVQSAPLTPVYEGEPIPAPRRVGTPPPLPPTGATSSAPTVPTASVSPQAAAFRQRGRAPSATTTETPVMV